MSRRAGRSSYLVRIRDDRLRARCVAARKARGAKQ